MSYVTMKSYGGVKGRAPQAGTGKRKVKANAILKAQRAAFRLGGQPSGVVAQAIRTGGWANPSRQGELKFIDVSTGGTLTFASDAFFAPILLNGCTQGSDATNRIGRKINIKSLYVRWEAHAGTTTTQGSPVRVIIAYDKQANAGAFGKTDLLLADDVLSPNNLSNRDRFVVLYDELSDTVANNAKPTVCGTCYKKLNLETLFNSGNAGTIGDIQTGSIYIMAAWHGTSVGTANGAFNFRSRIRFVDA